MKDPLPQEVIHLPVPAQGSKEDGSLMIWLLSQEGRNSDISRPPACVRLDIHTSLHCSGNNMRLERQKTRPPKQVPSEQSLVEKKIVGGGELF